MKIIVIDDSRGCPQRCGFCAHPVESGHRLRTAGADVLTDRMESIIDRYGVRAFRFSGSSTPGRLMAEVADEILDRGMDVTFTCFGHFASARPDHFERMAEAGLHAIFFGLESCCQEVLDRAVRKGLDVSEVQETVRRAQAAGIFVVASMIVPLPFDTEATIQESLETLIEIRPDSVPVQFPGVIPGTPWYNNPEDYGFAFDRDEYTRQGLDYKIKLLFPPSMWENLAYTLNGRTFREFTQDTMKFAAALEQAGILTAVPDDNALIAHCAEMDARTFRDVSRLWCTIGDAEAMGEMVARANRNIVRD
ncbi:MAG: radical SAM protein [Armatimonadia bacterium]|nr:radical SAM protein [Armatimonadia bacterium]